MVDIWWSLLGAAVPALVVGQAIRAKRKNGEEQRFKSAQGHERNSDEIFVCDRVCTSKRMLKKVGALSENLPQDTCVSVCGVSELDACADACARSVCVIQHQVPNWNDVCLKRYKIHIMAVQIYRRLDDCLMESPSLEILLLVIVVLKIS
ncbi:uncharacterized protein At5g64816 [Musa acuminata AAA Group]